MHAEVKKHKHHIIPRHMGGTDDPENLIELTIEEHAQAHLDLYNTHGKTEDLCAYYLLKGQAREGAIEFSRLGGRVSGRKNAESGHMKKISAALTPEARTKNGKKGAEVCRKKGVNSFFDPLLRTKACSKGGSEQGKRNSENGHLTKIAQDYWDGVSTGRIKRIKRFWVYSESEKRNIQIKEGSQIPEGYKKGRKLKW